MGGSVVSGAVVEVVEVVEVSAEVSALSSSLPQEISIRARMRASVRMINDLKIVFMIISF